VNCKEGESNFGRRRNYLLPLSITNKLLFLLVTKELYTVLYIITVNVSIPGK